MQERFYHFLFGITTFMYYTLHMRSKLTNKDKQAIRKALFQQIENLLFAVSDPNGGYDDLQNIDSIDIELYCYKIVGLYPFKD